MPVYQAHDSSVSCSSEKFPLIKGGKKAKPSGGCLARQNQKEQPPGATRPPSLSAAPFVKGEYFHPWRCRPATCAALLKSRLMRSSFTKRRFSNSLNV